VTRPFLLLALALAVPLGARAHEVLHELRRDSAVALRAYFADGEVLAYAPYELWSPADPDIPYQKGRTDRAGWLAFVPDVAGEWRVKVTGADGHGLDLRIDAAPGTAPTGGAAPVSTLAFVLRPLVGLTAILGVFAVLVVVQRRRGVKP
jgi:nickel transport protein